MTKPKRKLHELPPAQQAGILANSIVFRTYAAAQLGLKVEHVSTSAAAALIRDACEIDSRTTLNTNPVALEKYQRLCTNFDAWRGRIAAQHNQGANTR